METMESWIMEIMESWKGWILSHESQACNPPDPHWSFSCFLVEEFYGTQCQSGSFSLIDAGSIFNLHTLFFLCSFFRSAVIKRPIPALVYRKCPAALGTCSRDAFSFKALVYRKCPAFGTCSRDQNILKRKCTESALLHLTPEAGMQILLKR